MTAVTEPLLIDPKRLLLDLAQQRSVPSLLELIVSRLSETRRIALVRIWLAQPTSRCSGCPSIDVCRTGRNVFSWWPAAGVLRFHLVLSGPIPMALSDGCRLVCEKWDLSRQWATTRREPELIEPLPEWVAHPDWVRAEGIRGFAGQPMTHQGEVLGVLAVFARQPIADEDMGWLRMIADHAAAAIATARAFAEIDALRKRLELENEYLREEATRAVAFGELIGQSAALGSDHSADRFGCRPIQPF